MGTGYKEIDAMWEEYAKKTKEILSENIVLILKERYEKALLEKEKSGNQDFESGVAEGIHQAIEIFKSS